MRILTSPPISTAFLEEAVDCLRRGGLVAYPTDTLYGLGAAASDDEAVRRLFEAKKRPPMTPLPILVEDVEMASDVSDRLSPLALRLASRFWPGALTLVLPRSPQFHSLALAGGDTVAVRVPDHAVPLALVQALGEPLTGTSANVSGQRGPVTASDVAEQLGDAVDIIIDGGRCPGGVESTVVDLTGEEPRLVREGAISRVDLESAIGSLVLDSEG
jgi:L-threonylcarbamoyladenylate synthase